MSEDLRWHRSLIFEYHRYQWDHAPMQRWQADFVADTVHNWAYGRAYRSQKDGEEYRHFKRGSKAAAKYE